MQPLFMFKLDQRPDNCGLRCDEAGLFLGRQPLLTRDTEGNFEELPPRELRQTFRNIYGEEMESESRIRSVRLVADALNKGDMARATMVAVLTRETGSGTAQELILSRADWGGITQLADDWFLWCVPLSEIDYARREFESRGLIQNR